MGERRRLAIVFSERRGILHSVQLLGSGLSSLSGISVSSVGCMCLKLGRFEGDVVVLENDLGISIFSVR